MAILFLFLGWSLTSLIVNGSIFSQFRNYLLVKHPFFGKLVSCIQCTGLWAGAIIFIPLLALDEVPYISSYKWVGYIAYPIIQSGFAVILESLVIYLVKGSRSSQQ
jgi:hypothetical protein